MPKETINHSEEIANMDGHDCRVVVEWSKAQPRVTVSTKTSTGHYLASALPPITSSVPVTMEMPVTSAPVPAFYGFGCTVDEAGLDRLIEVLQRARRHAFAPPTGSAHYRQKAVKVAAIRYTQGSLAAVQAFLDEVHADHRVIDMSDSSEPYIGIDQVEHEDMVRPGDWVVRRPDGSVVPVGSDTFARLYEPNAA